MRMADVRGRLRMPAQDIAKFDDHMAKVRAHLADCRIMPFVFIAPNKQSIYPEKLRKFSAPYLASRIDDALEKVGTSTRAMLIDPRADLRAAKPRYPVPLYTPSDTHWNQLGAFIAYQKIVAVLAQSKAVDRPELATLDRYEIESTPTGGGDIATRLLYAQGEYPDELVTLRPKTVSDAMPAVAEAAAQVISNSQGKGRLLMQGDSFSPWLAGLLARHFAEVHLFRTPDFPWTFDGKLLRDVKPDVALVEIVERNLNLLVDPPSNLDLACNQR
jgi:alginate O-acetyltransferase complex protein AlgJ